MRTGQFFVLPGRTLGYQFLASAEEDVSGLSYDRLPDDRKIAYFAIYHSNAKDPKKTDSLVAAAR